MASQSARLTEERLRREEEKLREVEMRVQREIAEKRQELVRVSVSSPLDSTLLTRFLLLQLAKEESLRNLENRLTASQSSDFQ